MRHLIMFGLLLISCHQTPKKPSDQSNAYAQEIIVNEQSTVLYFLNTECPICQKYQGSFKSTFQRFGSQFQFYYIFPGQQSEADIKAYCQYDSIPLDRVYLDKQSKFSLHDLNATTTPQVIIIDKNRDLLYTGKIDDRFQSISAHKAKPSINYIEKALISLQKNEPIEISETIPVGCFIEPD